MTRVSCCVPFCGRTTAAEDPDEEWLCPKHFAPLPRALRVEYNAAWREADKADKRAADGLEVSDAPYVRVTDAWERLKAAAMDQFASEGGLR